MDEQGGDRRFRVGHAWPPVLLLLVALLVVAALTPLRLVAAQAGSLDSDAAETRAAAPPLPELFDNAGSPETVTRPPRTSTAAAAACPPRPCGGRAGAPGHR